jgi:hypothetical protein
MATYSIKFTVKGKGHFPMDMLRYDGCFPRDSRDVERLTYFEQDDPARTITLITRTTLKVWTPTAARWASFGWQVVEVSTPLKLEA